MQHPYWMKAIARSGGDLPPAVEEAAHLALADAGLCLDDMAWNPDLSRAVWRRAWDALHAPARYKESQADAVLMAGRPLAQTEVEHVVCTDGRAAVLEELTRWNALGPAALERALRRSTFRKAASGASSLLLQEGVPDDRVDELAHALNLWGVLRVLAFGPVGRLDREWAVKRLATFHSVRGHAARRNRMFQVALSRDADLASVTVDLACESGEVAQMLAVPLVGTRNGALAVEASGRLPDLVRASPVGSRGFLLMALAGNPSASEVSLRFIADGGFGASRASSMASSRLSGAAGSIPPGVDPSSDTRTDVLGLCVNRSLPGGMFHSAGRPERMLLLGSNPALTDELRKLLTERFAEALASPRPFERELWLTVEADRVLPGWDAGMWGASGGRLGRVTRMEPSLVEMFSSAGADPAFWGSLLRLGVGWSGTMKDLISTARLL